MGPTWFEVTRSSLESYVKKNKLVALTYDDLDDQTKGELSRCFSPEILQSFKIYNKIPFNDPKTWIGKIDWINEQFKGVPPAAQTFGNTIYMENLLQWKYESRKILIHELVHVAQYMELGYERFKEEYKNGMLEKGSYYNIPLEDEAYTYCRTLFDGGIFHTKFVKKPFFPDGMVFVRGGIFRMGSNTDLRDDEKPIHAVHVYDFFMSKYEVTQKAWKAVMGSNPSNFKGDNLPVEKVSWNDVQEFLQKLNQKEGVMTYRLPTEAEWEYAARGGSTSHGYIYSGSNNINDVAWFTENSGRKTHNVGTKSPNQLGIYDMSGNVSEWCSDWYEKKYYQSRSCNHPPGPLSGEIHVMRGGSWFNGGQVCRVSARIDCYAPRDTYYGFRLVRTK